MEKLDSRIASVGIPKIYPKDKFLFLAQEEAGGFFYIRRGAVRIFRMDENGREMEIVRLRPGDFFGEAVAFAGGRFPAFAWTVEETEVLYFDRRTVFRRIEEEPALAKFFLALLAGKCITLNERIEALGLRTVRQRLVQYLLSACEGGGPACQFKLTLKKTELARLLGTISETLSRNLRDLEDEGLIEVKGKTIRVPDCRRLRKELPS
jgi:CRP/FNR family transcriptional regulator